MVSASPMEKPSTSVAPRAMRLSCRHSSSTVIDAGHGIRPPVRPNSTIWPVVTSRPAKRRWMSSACSRAWASMPVVSTSAAAGAGFAWPWSWPHDAPWT